MIVWMSPVGELNLWGEIVVSVSLMILARDFRVRFTFSV